MDTKKTDLGSLKGYWEAADGSFVPPSRVKDVDKERDRVVRKLVERAQKLNEELAKFKADCFTDIAEFVQRSADDYQVVIRGAAGKGNVSLVTFDGRLKVERAMADRIACDERLQVAQALIYNCIQNWQKGANKNLQALVAQAFKTDKDGNVSVSRLLELRRHAIDDPEWTKGMDAIADSMRVVASKAYVRFYVRNDATGQYDAVPLNMAVL
jgi:hypothetical protein